jgi:hypothetical protein
MSLIYYHLIIFNGNMKLSLFFNSLLFAFKPVIFWVDYFIRPIVKKKLRRPFPTKKQTRYLIPVID